MRLKRLLAALVLAQIGIGGYAMAGDCWVKTVENPSTGFGEPTGAQRYAAMRARLVKLDAIQRADPVINAIAQVRYQVIRYIDQQLHPGVLAAHSSVWLHTKDNWKGACGLSQNAEQAHVAALDVRLNDLSMFMHGEPVDQIKRGLVYFEEPRQTGQAGGFPIYDGHVLVMTSGGVAPFVPLTLGEYLDDWHRKLQAERGQVMEAGAAVKSQEQEALAFARQIEKTDPQAAAEIRENLKKARELASGGGDPRSAAEWNELQRRRASLTPAQRQLPVYPRPGEEAQFPFDYETGAPRGGRRLVKVNPALWKGVRSESEVRTVVLQSFANDQQDAVARMIEHWPAKVEVAPYQALLGN